MLPFKLIYHEGYDLHLGAHVFPSQKFRLIAQKLRDDGIASKEDFLRPEPASDADILRVHTKDWVQRLKTGTLTLSEEMRLEVPYSPELVRAFWLAAGGTILAARGAIRDGFGCNLGGGFHHACADHGEGFCVLHDVAIAIRRLQKDAVIERAMTVDCDVHHGNGTAEIFAGDGTVFTFSIHQERNYPYPKPPSDLDLHLPDGVTDEEYLAELEHGLDQSLARFQPDMIFYLAGADPYHEDQLGGLKLSLDGLMRRDGLVFEKAKVREIPVVVTLAGGYARRVSDTVLIHTNTIRTAQDFAS